MYGLRLLNLALCHLKATQMGARMVNDDYRHCEEGKYNSNKLLLMGVVWASPCNHLDNYMMLRHAHGGERKGNC
jgi:hypothetical protein